MVQAPLPPSPHQDVADSSASLKDWLEGLVEQILAGTLLDRDQAIALSHIEGQAQILMLCEAAERVRAACCGNTVDLCSITNIKSGNCSENCSFCSQSAHHPGKDSPIYGLRSQADILADAKRAEAAGAKRFCLVSQGRGPKYGGKNNADFEQVLATVRAITEQTNIKPCCALGEVTLEQAQALREAGVTRYNHNLESSQAHFPKVVTTHSWQDRVATIQNLKAAGIQACSGGILGMGESWEDRIDLALALRDLAVESVPINLLNPRAGTTLGSQPRLDPYEAAKAIAIFRLLLPQQILRYAGGREVIMGNHQDLGFKAGINAMLVGHYLTTLGQPTQRDHELLDRLGLQGGEAPVPGEYPQP
ncbi:biotin synthase BioB [Lyngbya confervoides]|uniref:Biotin synthase n=1 Tax=Lyngbya confervoides BDU141951 TaxID=1574623 RepID=A0ABD4T4H9_9CYAN|nr:biotin synthase BioB [Lyngbya confervoides]MCM1983495.1 biotin synthase BioB [Lyngbya confervoides BDU141951]